MTDDELATAVTEAIIHGIDPGVDHKTGHVKVAVYVDDFTLALADRGYEVCPVGENDALRGALTEIAGPDALVRVFTASDGEPAMRLIEPEEFARRVLEGVNDDRS